MSDPSPSDSPAEGDLIDRSTPGKRAAATRRENKLLPSTPYGRLLRALRDAQVASDRAKSRAADATRYSEYNDRSEYRWHNYHASRSARQRDYAEKSQSIAHACNAAGEAGIVFGWAPSLQEDVPWIVYFDLPTGQMSFHCNKRGQGPEYGGNWDGLKDEGTNRVQRAIDGLITGQIPCPPPDPRIIQWYANRPVGAPVGSAATTSAAVASPVAPPPSNPPDT